MSNHQGAQPSNGFMPEQAFGDINRRKGPEADVIELKTRRQFAIRGGVQGLEKHVFVPASPEVQQHAAEQEHSSYGSEAIPTHTPAEVASAERDQVQMGQSATNTIQNIEYDRPAVPGTPQTVPLEADAQQTHMESIHQEVARLRAQQDQLANDNFATFG